MDALHITNLCIHYFCTLYKDLIPPLNKIPFALHQVIVVHIEGGKKTTPHTLSMVLGVSQIQELGSFQLHTGT